MNLNRLGLLLGFYCLVARAQVDVSADLETIRAHRHMPGLTAMAVKNGRILAQGTVGIRRQGNATPLLATDPINIASCTKWMTATLAGRLVDRGAIRWDTKIRDLFPNYAAFNPAFWNVTLDQLLCHQGGVEDSTKFESLHAPAFLAQSGNLDTIRAWVCETVLKDPPVAAGVYSNQGYVVAAVMMENATGKDWEALMRAEIFEPLRMNESGFGFGYDNALPPKSPVGHTLGSGALAPTPNTAMTATLEQVVHAAYGPGGYVLCPLRDWAKFLHIQVTADPGDFLSPATAAKLKRSFTGGEGYGRGVNAGLARTWATPGSALTHSGDIFGQDTVFWAAPARNFFVIAYTNCRSDDNATGLALDDAAGLLVSRYAGATATGPLLELPTVTSIAAGPETFTLEFQTLRGLTYVPEVSTDFINWTVPRAGLPVIAASAKTSFTDTRLSGFNFYRAKALP